MDKKKRLFPISYKRVGELRLATCVICNSANVCQYSKNAQAPGKACLARCQHIHLFRTLKSFGKNRCEG